MKVLLRSSRAPTAEGSLSISGGRPELEPVTLVSFPCSHPQAPPYSLLEQQMLLRGWTNSELHFPPRNSSRDHAPLLPLLGAFGASLSQRALVGIPLPPEGT